VEEALDDIENDPGKDKLWNLIARTLNLICDHPESQQARRSMLRRPDGFAWLVELREPSETVNYAIIWSEAPQGLARFHYVGQWPPPH
jgi:hypothetical protein